MKHIASFRPRFFEVFRGYSRQTFSADLMAGLVVGIVALPLAIAFGIASGAVSYTYLTLPTKLEV